MRAGVPGVNGVCWGVNGVCWRPMAQCSARVRLEMGRRRVAEGVEDSVEKGDEAGHSVR